MLGVLRKNISSLSGLNGSLHEWSEPIKILNEVYRVLKPKGKFFISDLRRDMSPVIKWFLKLMAKPKEIKPGLISSINASYTPDEVQDILEKTKMPGYQVKKNILGLVITGEKMA
ncbi:MAG: class I SAM-dependent methyltransferase [candidate division KSB1 bacterium]|nr:class I SAM-dependent methyltransferase [candidate division KSB1 bacterium]